MRVVKYTADEFGFHPVVTYEGDCQQPSTSFLPSSPSTDGQESLMTKPVQASTTSATAQDKTIDLNPLSRPVQSAITPSFTPGEEAASSAFNGGQNVASFRPTLLLDSQAASPPSSDYSLSLSDSQSDGEKASERFTPVLFQQFQNLTNLPFAVLGSLAQQIGQIGRPTTTTTTTTAAPSTSASVVQSNNNANTIKENSKFSSGGGSSVNILSPISSSNPNPRDDPAIPDSILTLLQSFPSNEQRSSPAVSEEDPVKASASEVVSDVATDSSSSSINTERAGTADFFAFPTLPNPVHMLETLIPGISSVAKPTGNSVPIIAASSVQEMESAEGGVTVDTTQGPPESTSNVFPVISLGNLQPSTEVIPETTTTTIVPVTNPSTAVPGPVQMLQNLVPEPLMNLLQNLAPNTGSNSQTRPVIDTPAKVDTTVNSAITDTDDSHDSQSPTFSSSTTDTLNTPSETLKSDTTSMESHNSHILTVGTTEKETEIFTSEVTDVDTHKSESLLTPEGEATPMIVPHAAIIPISQNANSLAIEIADPNLRKKTSENSQQMIVQQQETKPAVMTETRSLDEIIVPSSFEETQVTRDVAFPAAESSINPIPGTIIISQPVESGPFVVRTPKKMPMNSQPPQQKVTQQQQTSPTRMAAVVPARTFLSMPYGMRTMHHQAYVPAYQIGTADYGRHTNQQQAPVPYSNQRMHSAPAVPMSVSNNNGQTAGSFNSYTVQPPSQTHPTWSPYYSAYVYH